jgi:hypothetical protein
VIAYVIAWALFAFQRMILREVPFMPERSSSSARRSRCRFRFWRRHWPWRLENPEAGRGSHRHWASSPGLFDREAQHARASIANALKYRPGSPVGVGQW